MPNDLKNMGLFNEVNPEDNSSKKTGTEVDGVSEDVQSLRELFDDTRKIKSNRKDSKEIKVKDRMPGRVLESQRDINFKKFFKNREHLAALLKTLPEFSEYSFEKLQSCIRASDMNVADAQLLNTQDLNPGVNTEYDILTILDLPDGCSKKELLIYDIEMQNNYTPGYFILDRALYYCSKLLANQKKDYEDLLPVHAIWVCTQNIPKELQNRLIHFTFEGKDTSGNILTSKIGGNNLISIDFVMLDGSPNDNSSGKDAQNHADWMNATDQIVLFLQAVFHGKMSDKRFNPYLKNDETMKQEVAEIMSEYNRDHREVQALLTQGIAEGMKKGRAEGKAEGKAEGEIRIIYSFICEGRISLESACESLGITKEELLEKMEEYNLDTSHLV